MIKKTVSDFKEYWYVHFAMFVPVHYLLGIWMMLLLEILKWYKMCHL